jgi:aspartyl-tRNA(Asn)/glutamyl-tRNA(Gln) amidotransferase subunit C
MARVTPEVVDHVARLARLSLTDEERRLFAGQLVEILAWAESLQSLDTSGAPPTSHAGDVPAFREDEPLSGLARETVLGEAPEARDGLFRVPRVIGG